MIDKLGKCNDRLFGGHLDTRIQGVVVLRLHNLSSIFSTHNSTRRVRDTVRPPLGYQIFKKTPKKIFCKYFVKIVTRVVGYLVVVWTVADYLNKN